MGGCGCYFFGSHAIILFLYLYFLSYTCAVLLELSQICDTVCLCHNNALFCHHLFCAIYFLSMMLTIYLYNFICSYRLGMISYHTLYVRLIFHACIFHSRNIFLTYHNIVIEYKIGYNNTSYNSDCFHFCLPL